MVSLPPRIIGQTLANTSGKPARYLWLVPGWPNDFLHKSAAAHVPFFSARTQCGLRSQWRSLRDFLGFNAEPPATGSPFPAHHFRWSVHTMPRRPSGSVQNPSGGPEINVADAMLPKHGVEPRQVFCRQLLKVLCRFFAGLLQLFLHGGLLRRGRKIRIVIELVEQVVDLLRQHR